MQLPAQYSTVFMFTYQAILLHVSFVESIGENGYLQLYAQI